MHKPPKPKPFDELLAEIENGQLLKDLTEHYHMLVGAVVDTRKAGKLKLSLTLQPTGRAVVAIDAGIDVKTPEHDRPSTSFFVGDGFVLQRDDPEQPQLPMTRAETPDASEPRKVVRLAGE